MSVEGAEKRMHPRWHLKSSVSVFEKHSKNYLGLLVDCSEQGLMISTYDSLATGTLFELDLVDIPANVSDRRTGSCVAEVVWCDKITPSLYGSGLRILEHTPMLTAMFKTYQHAQEQVEP